MLSCELRDNISGTTTNWEHREDGGEDCLFPVMPLYVPSHKVESYKSLSSSCAETLGEFPESAQMLSHAARKANGRKGTLWLVNPCYPRPSGQIEHTSHYDRLSARTVHLDLSANNRIAGQFLLIARIGWSGTQKWTSHQLPLSHHPGGDLKISGQMRKHYPNIPKIITIWLEWLY